METKPEYLSLREAATGLGVNRSWLKGHLEALDVPLLAIGKTLAVRRDDLKRVKAPASKSMAVAAGGVPGRGD